MLTLRHLRGYRENVHTARVLACSASAAAALIAVSACTSNGSKATTTSSVTSASGSTSASSGTSHASATPSASAASATMKKLRGNCDSLLPQPDVEDTIGVRMAGKTAFVVGVPEKNIGRLGYLNCRYGLGSGAKPVPKVEVGVSLYNSPAQARRRLAGTIGDYQDHGASLSKASVAGLDATLVTGGSPGFDVPTLVVASGQRTVAVSITTTTLPGSTRGAAMAKLAALALDRTSS